ncbi:MAG: hypothetical protein V3V25_11335 [Paracoccaceae bacterium]
MKRLNVMQSFKHEDGAATFDCDVFTAAKVGLINVVQMPVSGGTSSLADKTVHTCLLTLS